MNQTIKTHIEHIEILDFENLSFHWTHSHSEEGKTLTKHVAWTHHVSFKPLKPRTGELSASC